MVTPLPPDQFCDSLQLFEQQSVGPLKWCRNISLCVESGQVTKLRTAGTSEIISIFLCCSNLRQAKLYVNLHKHGELREFQLIWRLLVHRRSKQNHLRVHLFLDIEPDLNRNDYRFDDPHNNLVGLDISSANPLVDCIPLGELSRFARLERLRIRPNLEDV